MGNYSCVCENSQIYNNTPLKNSCILEEPFNEQKENNNSNDKNNNANKSNPTNKNTDENSNKLKSKNIARLRQKYGTQNLIEEEASSVQDSIYSEMVNNSIYHLSSLISTSQNNNLGKSEYFENKNSLIPGAASPSSLTQSQKGSHYQSSSLISKTYNSLNTNQSAKYKQQQITLDILISSISSSNPEGDRLKLGQKIILRHLNSEMNLHSHFRKYERGSKLQEVSVCSSKMIHQHDFWIIDSPSNYLDNMNEQNHFIAQIDRNQRTDDTTASQSNDFLAFDDTDSQNQSIAKCIVDENESNYLKSPYIESMQEIILKHCVTDKQLASNPKYIHPSLKTQQVFCDEYKNKLQLKESFNWKIIVHNSDGYLHDNSIVQIIHTETNRPLSTHKQSGILSQTIEVVCGNQEYSSQNRQINDYWIINRVLTDSSIVGSSDK